MIIDFLVLACSYKYGARCLAGIDLSERNKVKPFVRLISSDSNTDFAIDSSQCMIGNRELQPLDVIRVNLLSKARSMGAQTENYIVDLPVVKEYLRQADSKSLSEYVRPHEEGNSYPFGSKDPFLSKAKYEYYTHRSLQLLCAYNVHIYRQDNNIGDSKTKMRFDIYIGRSKVTLSDYSVTDPNYYISSDGFNKEKTNYLGKAYLLISLGSSSDSYRFYKFVSGIIDLTNK